MRIIYNGIDLQVIDIQEAVCQPVYDDSNTDLLYCMYRLSVTAMVNGTASVNQTVADTIVGPALSLTSTGATDSQWTEQNKISPPGAGVGNNSPAADPTATSSLGKTKIGPTEGTITPNFVPYSPAIKSVNRMTTVVRAGAGPTGVTLQLLYNKLNEPRGQLWVFDGNGDANDLIIQSHSNTEVCDCKNGPLPIATNIVKSFGDGATYFINFQVQTFVDTQKYSRDANDRVLVSNRFSTTHLVNADSLLTILVQGVAHGKTNEIYTAGKSMDALRKSLFLPVPKGFMREQIQIKGSPDGSAVYYSYADVQQPVNFVAGRYVNATQIEAVHRQSVEFQKFEYTSLIDAYDRANSMRVNRAWRQEQEQRLKEIAEERAAEKKPSPMSRPRYRVPRRGKK